MITPPTRFNLGDKLRDRITGFEGIAAARLTYISGTVQYTLQPDKLDSGKVMDQAAFDWQRLEFVTAGPPGVRHEFAGLPKFEMGDRVADIVTDLKGLVTSCAEFIDGCVHYGVQPRKLKKTGDIVKPYLIDCQRLELKERAFDRPASSQVGGPQDVPRMVR